VYIPIFIFAGLFLLFKGLHFLIVHPIPFELLGVDLNSFLDSSIYLNIVAQAEQENIT
jgi:hypothetical protein